METASWVIVYKTTGKPLLETFSRKIADAVNRQRFDVIPIAEWLASLNKH